MRSLFERLGPIGVMVVLAWMSFFAFSLAVTPPLERTYEAFELDIPGTCSWSLAIARRALLLIPMPVAFVWRTPRGTARVVFGLVLIVVPIAMCALSSWPLLELTATLGD